MRHLLFIGLKCLFTLFLLALPLNGNAQMITTDVVATCNLHSVGVGVTLTGSTYTVSLSNLDNRKVKSVTYWVGDKTSTGTPITPTSGTYTFPKPATAGTIYVDVIVETNGRLFIAKGGATVTVTGSPVTTGGNTYAQGTTIKITAADVTSTSTSTITTITVVSITGSSADGTLVLSPVAKAKGAKEESNSKEITFTMPASDVTIQVNTKTSNTATIETPTGDTPIIKDVDVKAPTVTKPATGADATADPNTDYIYVLNTAPIENKEEYASALEELAQLKPAGDIILPMEITLTRNIKGSSTAPDTITSLTKPVMVILSYPEGVSKIDGIVILHAKRDGKIEFIYPTKQTNNFYFEVGSFSPFVLDITKSKNTTKFKLNGITPATASLKPRGTQQLTPTFSETIPKEDQTIIYTSSNTNVATVDNNGLITAHAVGSATIEAFSLFATEKTTAKCEVTVTSNPVDPSDPVTPDPPVTTQYTLTIPADSRFSSDPAAGTHTYDEGTAVKLTLTLLHADDKGKLTVKANDIVLPAASDGSYVVNMTANKTITFVWDTSVGNEQIQTATATARGIEGGRLEVNRLQPCSVTIVSLSGTCAGLLDTATGITYTHLPAGIYIVAFSTGECIKVQIR